MHSEFCPNTTPTSLVELRWGRRLDKESHLRILLKEKRIRSQLSPKSGRRLDKLLDLGVSESILALARQWLVDFPDNEYADFVLLNLLRAAPSKEHIRLACDWLSRNPTAERLFSWVRSNTNEQETVNEILPALLKIRPNQQVIEFSTNWIKTNGHRSFNSLAVLRPLLSLAPDVDLINIAQDLLEKGGNVQLNLSILEMLISTVKDASAIDKAKRLICMDADLSFRRSLAYSYGSLLLALFGCEESTDRLQLSTRRWLNFHKHNYVELAESIAAHLRTET